MIDLYGFILGVSIAITCFSIYSKDTYNYSATILSTFLLILLLILVGIDIVGIFLTSTGSLKEIVSGILKDTLSSIIAGVVSGLIVIIVGKKAGLGG